MRKKDEKLINSCRKGLIHEVEHLLKKRLFGKPANIEAFYEFDKETPLHNAVIKGYADIVQVLVNNGANIEARNYEGRTPLMLAVINNSMDIADFLIKNNALVDARDNKKNYLIHLCRDVEIFKLLLDKGVDPNVQDCNKNSLLSYIIVNHWREDARKLIKTLIGYNIDLNTRNNNGDTPLLLAIIQHNIEITELLLEIGCDPNMAGSDNNSPIIAAIKNKATKIVSLLIKKGADINTGNNGVYPLAFALESGYIEIADLLINSGADIHIRNRNGDPLLVTAIQKGNIKAVDFLINHGADISETDSQGHSFVSIAINNKYQDIAELLINNKAPYSKLDVIDKLSDIHEQMAIILELDKDEFKFNKERLIKIIVEATKKDSQKYMFDALSLCPEEYVNSELENNIINGIKNSKIILDEKWRNILEQMGWSIVNEKVYETSTCKECNGLGHVWVTPGEGAWYQEKESCRECNGSGSQIIEETVRYTGFIKLYTSSRSKFQSFKIKAS